MTYTLDKDLRDFRESIRNFSENKIRSLTAYLGKAKEVPAEIVEEMGNIGLFAIPFDEKYGGAGLSYRHYIIALEETAKFDGGLASLVACHTSLVGYGLAKIGFDEQKQKHLKISLAQMATDLRAARILLEDVWEKIDKKAEDYGRDAAMTKLFVGNIAESITSKALDMCGRVSLTEGMT